MFVFKHEYRRAKNAATLLHLLMKEDGISRAEMSRLTGLTKTTISTIIKKLQQANIVEESDQIATGNIGKSPYPLHINPDAVHTIGIHLGRKRVETLLMNARMQVIIQNQGENYQCWGPENIMKSLFANVDGLFRIARDQKIAINALGIGIPGPLDLKKGIVKQPPKFNGWIDVPIRKMIEERYEIPVWMENDASVGALAEKWLGAGRDIHNFIRLIINEGIGAGVVIEDKLYQGTYDFVGEIGHFLCFDQGQFTYLEDVAGVDILLERLRQAGVLVQDLPALNSLLAHNGKEKKLALSVIRELARWIASAIVNAIHMIGPQTVFISGKMAVLGEPFIQPIRQFVSHFLFGDQKVNICFSSIASDAVTLGAAIYATMRWLENKSYNL